MARRLPGSLLLILLFFGLLYTGVASADAPQNGTLTVSVSPLALFLQGEVIIQVGEFTCHFVNGIDILNVCTNLPPGDYAVSATSEGLVAFPTLYQIHIPAGNNPAIDLPFNFYDHHHFIYMPTVQP
jgi:hypothetical protein